MWEVYRSSRGEDLGVMMGQEVRKCLVEKRLIDNDVGGSRENESEKLKD